MKKTLQKQQSKAHIRLLRQGDERGLDYFYKQFYSYLFTKAFRATQDDCVSDSIVQEALLRLWLFREQIQDIDNILEFLKRQTRSAINAYYTQNRNRFHRSLLRLDSIEDYQEFLLKYDIEIETEVDLIQLEKLDEEKQRRLDQLHKVLPSLTQQQQLFIKLCLKYSFNYERIAYYLGGISDYEVCKQVEKTIETLKKIFISSQKMEILNKPSKIVIQGQFNKQQAQILQMRYELQLSFEQISKALKINDKMVKKLFVQAHAKIKSSKKTA